METEVGEEDSNGGGALAGAAAEDGSTRWCAMNRARDTVDRGIVRIVERASLLSARLRGLDRGILAVVDAVVMRVRLAWLSLQSDWLGSDSDVHGNAFLYLSDREITLQDLTSPFRAIDAPVCRLFTNTASSHRPSTQGERPSSTHPDLAVGISSRYASDYALEKTASLM